MLCEPPQSCWTRSWPRLDPCSPSMGWPAAGSTGSRSPPRPAKNVSTLTSPTKRRCFEAWSLPTWRSSFAAVTLRGDAVPEFVGDIYDLACRRPEHLRMMTWANLEGLVLEPPPVEGGESIARARHRCDQGRASRRAGGCGHGNPWTCLVLLFGIGLAWAQSPHPDALAADPAIVAARRAAAVEAARRIIAPAM